MLRVIVADDEEKVANLICGLVDWPALGMVVAGVAHNGLQALDMVKEHHPDILITDIRMPGCDGLALIQKAKALYPALSIVIISGHRQFDYAQTAIRYGVSDYLLKPLQRVELRLTLEKLRCQHQNHAREEAALDNPRGAGGNARLREGLFARIRQDGLPENLILINQEHHYHLREGCFQLVLVKADGEYDSLRGEGLALLLDKMDVILRETLSPHCHELELRYEGAMAHLLLNYDEAKSDAVRKGLHTSLEELRIQNSIFPSVRFTLAMGSVQNRLSALWESAFVARETLDGRILGGAGTLLGPTDPQPSAENRGDFVSGAVRLLRHEMAHMEPARLHAALDEIADGLLHKDRAFSGSDILHVAKELCHSYLWLARELGLALDSDTALYEDYTHRAAVCYTARQVTDCLREMLCANFSSAVRQQREADSRPIHAAKAYITAHYMNPLTLEDVAAQAGFNASYFSTLFKKETGQNFIEYLTETRIERAKELLRDTSEPLSAICEQVGYLDRKHFAALFKKLTGLKPGEFRKLYS